MKKLCLVTILAVSALITAAKADTNIASGNNNTEPTTCLPFMQHSEKKLHAKDMLDLCELTAGKPMLIVNTASHCGFTPQFTALEAIHQTYQEKGLVVIGFPSNDFFQEEDEEKDTADICFVNYGVTFTMLAPVHVWGSNAHAIFKELADKTTAPKWNFYKYLVSADGKTIKHFNTKVTPDSDVFIDAVNTIL
jgi:glutathione peroxidase|tara:strand:- start:12611 stop:13189 length:579 start_codon:yes stop_codon:yes gene_type:complete